MRGAIVYKAEITVMARGSLYFAGACRPNPGRASIGFVIFDENGQNIHQFGSLIVPEPLTTNIAHYRALIRGLNRARNRGITDILVSGHSLLVINQVLGRYRVRNWVFRKYVWVVRDILNKFTSYELRYVPWYDNGEARDLASECF